MHEPFMTVVGHVAGPPRLRTTPSGVSVADFRIASTPRRQDRAEGTWSDGETIWFGVTTWRGLAEHVASSLKKGDKVVVAGRLTTRSWEVEGGERRTGLELDAAHVGLDLSRGVAAYVKPGRLLVDEDPWISSGRVVRETGEVLAGEPDADEDDESAEEPVHAAA